MQWLMICSWCMPGGLKGSHGVCERCKARAEAEYRRACEENRRPASLSDPWHPWGDREAFYNDRAERSFPAQGHAGMVGD